MEIVVVYQDQTLSLSVPAQSSVNVIKEIIKKTLNLANEFELHDGIKLISGNETIICEKGQKKLIFVKMEISDGLLPMSPEKTLFDGEDFEEYYDPTQIIKKLSKNSVQNVDFNYLTIQGTKNIIEGKRILRKFNISVFSDMCFDDFPSTEDVITKLNDLNEKKEPKKVKHYLLRYMDVNEAAEEMINSKN